MVREENQQQPQYDDCWVSSYAYGGAPNSDDEPNNNLEQLLAELRAVSDIEHSFRVIQIGRAMLRRLPPSLTNLQLVLRDFYFNYRRYGSPAMLAEHLVTVSPRGLLFTSRDPTGEIEKIHSTQFGANSILQASAIRFTTRGDKQQKKSTHYQSSSMLPKPKIARAHQALISAISHLKHKSKSQKAASGRFTTINRNLLGGCTIDDDLASTFSNRNQPPWFLIQPEFEFLSNLYHPPLVALILRREHQVRSIDLHVFVCCSDIDAVQLVTFVNNLIERGSQNRQKSRPASFQEDARYYDRLIVQEATASTQSLQKIPSVPFVNPNVLLSENGTLTTSEKQCPNSSYKGRGVCKLATPKLPEKPTIYQVVDDESYEPSDFDEGETSEKITVVVEQAKAVIAVDTPDSLNDGGVYENPDDPEITIRGTPGELLPVDDDEIDQCAWVTSEILPRPVRLQSSYSPSEGLTISSQHECHIMGNVQSLLGYLP